MSPSKVRCDGPLYIPLQDHQFECPDCPLPNPPTLNGYSDLGMTGEVWPSERLPPSLQPRPRQRRPAPPPPPPLDLRRTLLQGSQLYHQRYLRLILSLERLVVEGGIYFWISWLPSPDQFMHQLTVLQRPGPHRLQGPDPHRLTSF